ncbi:MAG: APC family permease [Anaerolineae bacterium]|nr:APC family permease [Anaerolineae bacterium]
MATTQSRQKFSLGRALFGAPLATRELPHQAVSKVVGLAVFASDALSSTAYATEEILLILSFAGAAYFGYSIPIAIAIALLLIIVKLSYRQTIHAYPNGGGAYIVARDNLGELPAQIAAAALLTDYVLTVAVSISNGVAQITSGVRALAEHRVEIALLVIIFITIINLRGVKESGRIFAIPTYFFLAMAFLMLGVGAYRVLNGTLTPVEHVEAIKHEVMEPLTWFLILRAFSSGCTALTGIEAISNGIPAFKEPKSQNASRTLVWMSSILIVIFLGFTLLAHQAGVMYSQQETIISQIARSVYGVSPLYFVTLAGTALILLMAANTSYADFPRLAALVAGDGFLPRQLTIKGSRLVFSWGITVLGILASFLIVFFRAETSALIPLYAIGVFLSFTLSQSGMVLHTWKSGHLQPGQVVKTDATTLSYDRHWKLRMALSAFGAVVTGIVMVVFAVTKFTQGAFVIIILIPILVLLFFRIHSHYRSVAQLLSLSGKKPKHHVGPVLSILFVEDVHAGTLRMVDYAKSLGCPWKAVHIAVNEAKSDVIRQKWEERVHEGELIIVESPYRQLATRIREFIESEQEAHPDGYINVILGHLATDTLWEQVLHQNTAIVFNLALQDLDRVTMTTVPYQIHHITNGNGNGNGHGKDAAPGNAGAQA